MVRLRNIDKQMSRNKRDEQNSKLDMFISFINLLIIIIIINTTYNTRMRKETQKFSTIIRCK